MSDDLSLPSSPTMVMGCHRSGTSAVAGLLHLAGALRLGEVLPATAANPKGYFESATIVLAHNRALAAVDRDWTSPPAWLDPAPGQVAVMRDEVEQMSSEAGPWGVKDPRLLFTLPMWYDTVPRLQFVGVIRDHEEVVRSLIARDRLRSATADHIARVHVRRLLQLRQRFDFPIVDFSAQDTVVEQCRRAAESLGLEWSATGAAGFHDTELATTRPGT